MAIKVLNITTDDFANFSHDNAKALRSVGVDCQDIKTQPHVFEYGSQSKLVNWHEAKTLIWHSDIIQIMHSDLKVLNHVLKSKKKESKIVVYHTGTRYRIRPMYYNIRFNKHVEKSFIALGEFAGKGAKNEQYIVGAVDVSEIRKFGHEISHPYKLGHFPSNPEVKGTPKIMEMTCNIPSEEPYRLLFSTDQVSFDDQQKRIDLCDIYIELFKNYLKGKQYGSFGITALECAAAGKVVVTQNLNAKVYEKEYGFCPLVICNTEEKFKESLMRLLAMDPIDIASLQTDTYNWVKNNHSYKATGNKLKNILNGL